MRLSRSVLPGVLAACLCAAPLLARSAAAQPRALEGTRHIYVSALDKKVDASALLNMAIRWRARPVTSSAAPSVRR